MQSLGYQHISDEWRLCIDCSKTILKAVSFYNCNTKLSVPVAYAIIMKESYKSIKALSEAFEILEVFLEYWWRFESDFPTSWLTAGLHKVYLSFMSLG